MKVILNWIQVVLTIDQMARTIKQLTPENLCFISILKGGVHTSERILDYFVSEKYKTIVGYLGLSSYGNGTQTQEKIETTYPLDLTSKDLERKNLWIIDDIYDSGLTMMKAKSIIKQAGNCNSVRTAVLVRKMNPKISLWKDQSDLPDVVGYKYFYDKGFLVGSGMGMGEKYRCLDGVFELEPQEII